MDLCLFFSRIMGLYFFVLGFFLLSKRQEVKKVWTEVYQSPALTFSCGVKNLIWGLLVVLNYNVWQWHWTAIPTVIGWLWLVKGVLKLFFPAGDRDLQKKFSSDNALVILSVIMLIVSFVLIYKGFFEG